MKSVNQNMIQIMVQESES